MEKPPRSPSFSNDIFSSRFSGLENNRIRESLRCIAMSVGRFPNAAISYIVLKHEGNMPFENDGLRRGRFIFIFRARH